MNLKKRAVLPTIQLMEDYDGTTPEFLSTKHDA
ncbi:hypothetical protein PPM_0335 [Paenibacillus polymyxa M1]|nr:hypothetical protein PPM_0335 [Paenibacillus polymyxa M1]